MQTNRTRLRRSEAMGGKGKQTLIKTQERLHTIVSN